MKDIENINDIKLFVNEFYIKVEADDLLGPVFAKVIQGEWQPHLDKMYTFWNAVLFGEHGYVGNPFSKHAPLQINPKHFDRWLQLFAETIDSHFEGSIAEEAKKRAGLMAEIFMAKLQNMKGGPGRVIV
jgi:hemoglobin